MKSLRTPDERFADLSGYPFDPNYVDIDDQDGGRLRVHYLLTDAGMRVIAPDLVGFGKSDKPSEKSDYTYARHVAWMQEAIIDHLDLHDATFFGRAPQAMPSWRGRNSAKSHRSSRSVRFCRVRPTPN